MTETKEETKQETTRKNANARHIVELDDRGNPMDECLCGYLWDRVNVQHNGNICQECVEEARRRHANE